MDKVNPSETSREGTPGCRLHIDIETYSSEKLKETGLCKYVQSPDFQIMLFAYARGDEPVQIVDLMNGGTIPAKVQMALSNPCLRKVAHNAMFEWYCLSKHLGCILPIDQWECTQAHALYCGYPAALDAAGSAIGLSQDKQKLRVGQALIRKFCVPCKPTKTNAERIRNMPKHEPEQWELFKEYCKRDVEAEREIDRILNETPMPEKEMLLWRQDVLMNASGVRVDIDLINGALALHGQTVDDLTEEARILTDLENPNSVAQLKQWLTDATGAEVESLAKDKLQNMIDVTSDEEVKRVLQIRQELSKTSVKKYNTMAAAVGKDERVRGLLQYYGANRTGRWAGRLVQVQNLPRNYIGTLDLARKCVKTRNGEALKMLYGNIPDTLSQLIRTAFIPMNGCVYAVADFSAIEARVIAWLADESWRLDVFNSHGRIYEASASQMFGVQVDLIKKGNPEYALRQKGKVAELALGYQGSKGALIQMGAQGMGLAEEELPDIVRRWRAANRRICDLWYMVENAAVACVSTGAPATLPHGVHISRDENRLIITLPSGRQLFYHQPRLLPGTYGGEQVSYYGVNQEKKKWMPIPTYGGKLVENIVQAIARDCLAEALIKVTALENVRPVMHIHDEIVAEVPADDAETTLQVMIAKMCEPIPWAQGLPLNADGFISDYYKKE